MTHQRSSSVRTRLSLFQESMWYLGLLDPDNSSFNVGRAWKVKGHFNLAALQFSVDQLVTRHEILRSRVEAHDGLLYQVAKPHEKINYSFHDLSAISSDDEDIEIYRNVRTEYDRIFDLANEPPLRVVIFRVSELEHILLIVKPHITTDVYSFGVMVRELSHFYAQYLSGEKACLPAAKQFSDYALLQRKGLQTTKFEEHLSYWKGQLAGCSDDIPLPTLSTANASDIFASNELSFTIPDEIMEQLSSFTRSHQVSNYMFFIMAFSVLLRQLSGQEDIIIGGLLANRIFPSTRNLIGPVVNTIALRFDLSGNPTFEEVLLATRRSVNNAYRYVELPFEKIMEDMKKGGDLKKAFHLNVVFNYFQGAHEKLSLPGTEAQIVRIARDRMPMALNLRIEESQKSCNLTFGYRALNFTDQDIGTLFSSYSEILEAMLKNPSGKIDDAGDLSSDIDRSTTQANQMEIGIETRRRHRKKNTEAVAEKADDDQDVSQTMSQVWAEVFGVSSVDPDDDFFIDLGGHSLTAMELLLKVAEVLDVELGLDSLFSYPTVRELSELVIERKENAISRTVS